MTVFGSAPHEERADAQEVDGWELRVVAVPGGGWTVLDGYGYGGCFHNYETPAEAQAWLDGYESGARENM